MLKFWLSPPAPIRMSACFAWIRLLLQLKTPQRKIKVQSIWGNSFTIWWSTNKKKKSGVRIKDEEEVQLLSIHYDKREFVYRQIFLNCLFFLCFDSIFTSSSLFWKFLNVKFIYWLFIKKKKFWNCLNVKSWAEELLHFSFIKKSCLLCAFL